MRDKDVNYIKDYDMSKQPGIYILTNKPHGTIYTGVTSNLVKRVWQHKNKITGGFTSKYNLTILVYYELHQDMYQAIHREKQIKSGSRMKKINLIENSILRSGCRHAFSPSRSLAVNPLCDRLHGGIVK